MNTKAYGLGPVAAKPGRATTFAGVVGTPTPTVNTLLKLPLAADPKS